MVVFNLPKDRLGLFPDSPWVKAFGVRNFPNNIQETSFVSVYSPRRVYRLLSYSYKNCCIHTKYFVDYINCK